MAPESDRDPVRLRARFTGDRHAVFRAALRPAGVTQWAAPPHVGRLAPAPGTLVLPVLYAHGGRETRDRGQVVVGVGHAMPPNNPSATCTRSRVTWHVSHTSPAVNVNMWPQAGHLSLNCARATTPLASLDGATSRRLAISSTHAPRPLAAMNPPASRATRLASILGTGCSSSWVEVQRGGNPKRRLRPPHQGMGMSSSGKPASMSTGV